MRDLERAYDEQFSKLFEGLFVNIVMAQEPDGTANEPALADAEKRFHHGCVLLDKAYAIAKSAGGAA